MSGDASPAVAQRLRLLSKEIRRDRVIFFTIVSIAG